METKNFLKSGTSKFVLGMILVFGLIILAKSGYLFGRWLHGFIN